ncbi:MAG: hypothetical protein IJS15_09060 [Victivallales bacterium]|nr:hypothetical protein [Victivallales bacterium]
MKRLLIVFMLLTGLAFAGIRIDVQNGGYLRFQQVVDVRMTAEQYNFYKSQALNEIESSGLRTPVPFAWSVEPWDGGETEYVLSILMTGLTNPNVIRSFEFAVGDAVETATDLTSSSDETASRISNQYFSLKHKAKGNGGIFSDIHFMLSGTDDNDLTLLDRSFTRGIGIYSIENDREASAKIVCANPLRVVAESKTRYVGDKAAPGDLRAVYHYSYNAFSPVVNVSAKIEKDDDTEWKELHFLHLTSKVRKYDRFVMSKKGSVDVHELLPKGTKSCGAMDASDWIVMEDAKNAVGVGGPTLAWDASKEYYDFIRSNRMRGLQGAERTVGVAASMYLGPASVDRSAYAKWLSLVAQPKWTVRSNVSSATDRGEFKGEHILENNELRIAFAGAADGFACVGIEKADHKGPIFCNAKGTVRPLWKLHFMKGTDSATMLTVNGNDVLAAQTSVERIENGLKIIWKGVALGNGGTFDAVAKVVLDGGKSEWTLEVENHSKEYGLWDSEFPVIANVLAKGTADAIVPHGNWGGALYHNFKGGYSGTYPSAGAPLQMMALMRDGYGLYYGMHDGAARRKNICIGGGTDMFTRVMAEDMGKPGSGQKADFPVVLQIFEGDWWAAAKIYRSWALKQAWTSRGPIKDDAEYPKLMKEMGFWFLLNSGNDKQVEEVVGKTMDKAFAKATVPTGVHWYCWHCIPFDNSYPEYFPIKNGVKEATARMTKRGQVVMPYINGRLWDTDIDSFAAAKPFSCMNEDGNNYIEVYGSKRKLAPMCPYTKFWQDKINEVGHRLIHEVGFNGIYLDQIGAAGPALCFNPDHGHPLGGGRHWVDGYRTMLSRLRSEAAKNGVMLTTENTAEPYMDNINGFLAWNPRNDTDVPLLPAVYSGYTTYFTSPQESTDTLVAFRAAQGRDAMWGCQIGWHYFDILNDAHKEKFDFSMRLAELRLATKEFMVFGELLGEVKPLNSVPTLTMTWGRQKPHTATLPAVQGYEWADAKGRRCIYIINYSDSMQSFEFNLPRLSSGKVVLRRVNGSGNVPMAVNADGGCRSECLEPGEILAFTVEPMAGKQNLEKEAREYLKKGGDRWLEKAANEFLFRQSGLFFDINRNVVSVDGEFTRIDYGYGFANSGRKRTLIVEWPDGTLDRIVVDSKLDDGWKARSRVSVKDFGGGSVFHKNFVKVSIADGEGSLILPFNHIVRDPLHVEVGYPESVFAGEDFMVTVVVGNSSNATKDATVLLQVPEDWMVEPSKSLEINELHPKEHRMAVLKCRAPVSTLTKNVSIATMLLTGRRQHQMTMTRSRPTATAAKAKAILIDGRLDEWGNVLPVIVSDKTPECIKYSSAKYNGSEDCSAELRFAWDDENLYIAAKVKDDKHYQNIRGSGLWAGDCIQFAVTDGGPLPMSRSMDVSALNEFAISADDKGPFVFSWCSRDAGVQDNAKIAVTGGNGEIIYEVALPWESINIPKPFPGKKLGLSFVVADNDGDSLRGWLEWTPGIFGSKDCSAYGTVTLE